MCAGILPACMSLGKELVFIVSEESAMYEATGSRSGTLLVLSIKLLDQRSCIFDQLTHLAHSSDYYLPEDAVILACTHKVYLSACFSVRGEPCVA